MTGQTNGFIVITVSVVWPLFLHANYFKWHTRSSLTHSWHCHIHHTGRVDVVIIIKLPFLLLCHTFIFKRLYCSF